MEKLSKEAFDKCNDKSEIKLDYDVYSAVIDKVSNDKFISKENDEIMDVVDKLPVEKKRGNSISIC